MKRLFNLRAQRLNYSPRAKRLLYPNPNNFHKEQFQRLYLENIGIAFNRANASQASNGKMINSQSLQLFP